MTLSPSIIEDWYRRYGPLVHRRCKRLLKSDELAREAMQDVFVKVLLQAEHLDAEVPTGLLYRIATNVCLNLIRSRKARPEDADGEVIESIATAPDFEAGLSARNALAKVFRGQQESTRVIATLHLLDKMTLEEVAAEVGLSVSGVRKRLATLKTHVKGLEHI